MFPMSYNAASTLVKGSKPTCLTTWRSYLLRKSDPKRQSVSLLSSLLYLSLLIGLSLLQRISLIYLSFKLRRARACGKSWYTWRTELLTVIVGFIIGLTGLWPRYSLGHVLLDGAFLTILIYSGAGLIHWLSGIRKQGRARSPKHSSNSSTAESL